MSERNYNIIEPRKERSKAWKGFAIESVAEKQLRNVAAMPDAHGGLIEATVGVDIGCGMIADDTEREPMNDEEGARKMGGKKFE